MKKITKQEAENLANKFRFDVGLSFNEPIHIKSILRKENVFTIYRQLDDESCGISVKSAQGHKFILVNSSHNRGRQHFTIAHELYHLYYDDVNVPHVCKDAEGNTQLNEYNANLFASCLLMPHEGLLQQIPQNEITEGLSIATLLRLEQYFQVSRSALLVRLSSLKIINNNQYEAFKQLPVIPLAKSYGYDTSLYESGNNNKSFGDFGEKARILYDMGKISEGHYLELLNMLNYGEEN